MKQAAIFLHASRSESIFWNYAQMVRHVDQNQSQEEEIITKDVWGAAEKKMYFRTSVLRVNSRAGNLKNLESMNQILSNNYFFDDF